MAALTDRVMVAIFKDTLYDGRYKAIYFTELDEHGRDVEIGRAMKGEQAWGGFLSRARIDDARGAVDGVVKRLNDGETLSVEAIDGALKAYLK
jgi:hypothetical protein